MVLILFASVLRYKIMNSSNLYGLVGLNISSARDDKKISAKFHCLFAQRCTPNGVVMNPYVFTIIGLLRNVT